MLQYAVIRRGPRAALTPTSIRNRTPAFHASPTKARTRGPPNSRERPPSPVWRSTGSTAPTAPRDHLYYAA
ncbi:unnamed protein product [Bursaphelenchus xylophilus]|uniref:(pine wood nematode) hypothetical protein n=1 Tax=Bursaphelenchus xylophilus TaxID=6326 RepID=A0A7I8WNQ7_BURXY|nr:unnamed protein product [Bursaphelenchus xylophilus]CAG9093833.1 unnamed protein product [Bursaphelenchus xylophilus]